MTPREQLPETAAAVGEAAAELPRLARRLRVVYWALWAAMISVWIAAALALCDTA